MVAKVVELIGAVLEDANLQIAPTKFADLVIMVYEDALPTGVPSEAYVKQLIKLLR